MERRISCWLLVWHACGSSVAEVIIVTVCAKLGVIMCECHDGKNFGLT